MALNLGDIEKQNQNENSRYTSKVDGVSFRQIPTAPITSNKNKSKKKNYYSVLDNGYQFGDLTRIFLGEAGRGINDFKNTVVSVPKGIVDTTKNIINESDALKDGYQFGDATKTIGSTLLSTGQNFGEGVIRGAEGIVDFGVDLTGGISDRINTKLEKAVGLHKGKTEKEVNKAKAKSRKDMISTNYTDELMKAVGKDDFYKDSVESNSLIKTDNMGGAITQEIGRQSLNLLANAGIGSKKKIIQSLPMLAGAYGSGVEEAYQNGATTSEARKYGALNAATETVTEWITGGVPGLKGSAGKGLDGIASKLIGEGVEETSKSLAKALLKSGYKLVGKGTEELISEFMNPYLKQFTYEYNKSKDVLGNLGEATSKVSIQDMLTSFIMGAVTAGIMDAPNMASDIKSGYKNGKPAILPSQNNNNALNIKENTINLGEIANDNININRERNVSLDTLNMPNNDTSNNIVNSHNANQQQIEKYQYLPSSNKKINILNETASKYFDNSKRTRDMLNTFSKIITDKNYTIMFDDKLSNNSNNFVNGQIRTLENGETEIRINPNSERAGEFLIMHEVTHAIETESMKNLVIDYAMKNKEFPQALESLKQTYGTDDVSSEVLADVSGQLFGNQEFINNLSMKQPNIFNKIYNKIIELANKITGNSKESLFIKDLKNKWETAYRTQNNNIDNQKYHISPNLSTDIDNVLNNINERNPVRVRDYTPKVLVAYGIEDLPMYENPSHIRKNILTAKEARNMGLSVMPKDHYHGLGKDLYIKAIDSLDNPRVIFKRNNSNNYVILTAIKDNNNNNVIVPIEIETTTNVNNIKIDTNRVKTVYGYDIKNPDLNDYIKHNLNNNEFIKIYEQKKERGTGNSTVASSFYSNSITQSNDNVKLPTKYSMQNSQNNTSELSNSSFSLEQRVSGDNLLDAQDLIEEIKSVGAKVDKNGYVTVYHQTSSENAKKIRETGKMISKENDIFFSTSKNASQSDGRGQVKLEFKIPAEKLMLDDIFSDNADVKISLNGQKSLDVSRYIIDTKYSQNNDKWQEHLEKNYKATGTRTDLKSINNLPAPKKYDINNLKKEKNTFDNYKNKKAPLKEIREKKIENNENTIYNLMDEKQQVQKRIQDKISVKQELLKSKKNQDTKLAANITMQIEMLKNQLENRQLEYDKKIQFLESRNEKLNSNEVKIKEQRYEKKQEYIDQAYKIVENMLDWTDKKTGIQYQINTMKRNLYDIMPKADADLMYKTYFEPISDNNAKSNQFITSYNDRIQKLNLNNKESIAVQMLGEYKYNSETLLTGAEVNRFIYDNNLDYDKLTKAVNEFRNIYDELIVEINKTLKEQGYKEIEYRKGYFPHFQEETSQSKFQKLAEKLGIKKDDNTLPTDIAGQTDIFRPGKTYFKNAEHRKGKITDYNALKGFDNYIRGAADLIFHTEDIQKLRALEHVIRTQYTDKTIREQFEKISNDENLSKEQKQDLFEREYLKINNPLPNFVTEIRNYTDSLANKKDIGDRGMEHMFGRQTYTIMKNVQSRVSANMVGFNISSALTNFIPITQAWGEVSTKNLGKAIKESIANQFHNDGFEDCSTYLINRTKQADRLYKTTLDNINSKAGIVFEGIDSITSNTIVRAKYYDNIDKGMSQENAIRNANEFAKDIMAARDKGSMPTIFNRKSPLVKLFTAFQLEVNNQYGYLLKDLPRNLGDEAKKKLIGALTKMFVGAWLYNKFSESVTGRKSAFSPIDIAYDSIKTTQNDKLSIYNKLSLISEDLVGELPFIGGIAGGGRLPIQAALPNIGTTTESITELIDGKNKAKSIKNLSKELSKPLFYVALPFGGGQLKKTIEGASMYTHDVAGSYTTSGKLRFEADKTPIGVTKSLLFGQYSSKNASDYFEKGYAPLSENQIKEFKNMNISLKEYRSYREELSKLSKIEADKASDGKTIKGSSSGKKAYNIMNNDNLSKRAKEYLLSHITSSSDNESIDNLKKLPNDLEIYKFYYSLSKEKKTDFLTELTDKNFNAYELYDYYKSKKSYEGRYTSTEAKTEVLEYLINSNFDDKQKIYLYSKTYSNSDNINLINQFGVRADNYFNTLKYVNKLKNDYQGKDYTNYRKQQTFSYINNLNASLIEKIILFKQSGYAISNYKEIVFNYIEGQKLTKEEKQKLWNSLY